jgi:hypothetical protein
MKRKRVLEIEWKLPDKSIKNTALIGLFLENLHEFCDRMLIQYQKQELQLEGEQT